MDVEEQLMGGVRVAFLVLAPNGAIGRTDVGADYLTQDVLRVEQLRELGSRVVLQQARTFRAGFGSSTLGAGMGGVVEGFCEEPQAVDCAAKGVALG